MSKEDDEEAAKRNPLAAAQLMEKYRHTLTGMVLDGSRFRSIEDYAAWVREIIAKVDRMLLMISHDALGLPPPGPPPTMVERFKEVAMNTSLVPTSNGNVPLPQKKRTP